MYSIYHQKIMFNQRHWVSIVIIPETKDIPQEKKKKKNLFKF